MIVICEPLRLGFDHSQVNAAVVGLFAEAFPEEELIFCAESNHIDNVKKLVEGHCAKVTYVETIIPDVRQTLARLALIRRMFTLADKKQASQIVFCTADLVDLVSIKTMLRRFSHILCLVVLHDLQKLLSTPQSHRLRGVLLTYRRGLLVGNTLNLRYVVVGPCVGQNLKKCLPGLSKYILPIDLPYFFKDFENRAPFGNDIIRFGFYGYGSLRKGTDVFFRLADDISLTKTKCRPAFVLIGQILDHKLKEMPHLSVSIPSPDAPLSQEEYEEYGKCIDYSLSLHSASAYELNTSGAILDAFLFLKPIIALKTPMSEYYFSKMGDIGYLCKDYDHVKDTIKEILETRPTDRYRVQQNNLLSKRNQFSPAGIAPEFRTLLLQDFAPNAGITL